MAAERGRARCADVYRFDGPDPGRADAFGACCAIGTIEVAFAERVIHGCGRFVAGNGEVPASEHTRRSVVRLACGRPRTPLRTDLTEAAPESPGLNNDISASADRTTSQARAPAIRGASQQGDGHR